MNYENFKSKFQIGMAAVVLLVIMRLGLGCHFFYEGVWKITHPEFSAEPFLTQAKGPLAPMFYAMVYDIDGRERLKLERLVTPRKFIGLMRKVRDDSETRYQRALKKEKDLSEKDKKAIRQFRMNSRQILWDHEDKLEAFIAENEQQILAHFAPNKNKHSAEEKKAAQKRVRSWLTAIAQIEKQYFAALKETAKNDKVLAQAVGRSCKARLPKVDDKTDLSKHIGARSLLGVEKCEIFRIDVGIKGQVYLDTWKDLKEATADKFALNDWQKFQAEKAYRLYKESVWQYMKENREDVAAYFGSLDRLEAADNGGNNGASHQKKRLWDEQMKLRGEVGAWLGDLDDMEDGYHKALWGILNPGQKAVGSLPVAWTRSDLINLAVTYSLTAIGLCLLLGLFCRPAAIGGGVFMFFVVLTQPAWPTIYPPAPPVAGHALLVNKDFIEMIALFLMAATAVGRWGGLDYFVENYLVNLWNSLTKKKT